MSCWLSVSNRPRHVRIGLLVYAGALLYALLIGIELRPAALVAFMTTGVAAVTKEVADRLHGGSFDPLDTAATLLLPFCLTLLTIIISLLWLS